MSVAVRRFFGFTMKKPAIVDVALSIVAATSFAYLDSVIFGGEHVNLSLWSAVFAGYLTGMMGITLYRSVASFCFVVVVSMLANVVGQMVEMAIF